MATMTMQRPRSGVTEGSAERAGAVAPLAFGSAIICVIAAQLSSTGAYNSLRDPLSGLAWTSQGWLFPLALALLAIGMLCAATSLHRIRPHVGLAPVLLLAAGGAAGGVAACFPADRAGASLVSAGGEIHRWASLALLVLPTVAALRVSVILGRTSPGRQGAAHRHRLIALIVAIATTGLVFIGGFLPTLLHTDISLFTSLAQLNGMAQRVLVLLVVLATWQLGLIARARLTERVESGSLQTPSSEHEASTPAIRMGVA
jgi:hypothetical protein